MLIPKPEIAECSEREIELKIGNIFANENVLEECSVKIYKIDPYFCEHYKEKMYIDKDGCEYMLFKIDVYFTEYLLAKELKKEHDGGNLIFEEKRQEVLEKKL